LWDTVSGQELRTMSGEFNLAALAFNPDGRLLAGATNDESGRRLVLWDTATGEIVSILKSHYQDVRSLAFTPDSRRVALVGRTQTGADEVKLWDTASGHELLTLKPERHVTGLAFGPDGHRLLAAGTPTAHRSKERRFITAAGPIGDITRIGRSGGEDVGQVQVWDATPRPEGPSPPKVE
jgi:WD40 repeat protein